MKAVADEANEVAVKDYVLIGFQVVESERQIVSLYRCAVVPQLSSGSLVGE